jgi:hypothetical protein
MERYAYKYELVLKAFSCAISVVYTVFSILNSLVLCFVISTSFDQMVGEKKTVDPALSEFYEAMERTNAEKIAHETLARLYEDSSDSEDFDAESETEDAEDRPWRPSHVVFGKSTIKQG